MNNNLSFSPTSEAVAAQSYPFSPAFSPEEPVSYPTTVQVYRSGSTISLEVGAKASQTAWLSGVNLDDEGTSIQTPLKVFICEDETGVHAENEELSIFACGQTVSEAIDDFIETLFSTWQGLKHVPESDLTADAIDLRRRLMTYIKGA
jgi:hypothetical protein